MPGAPESGGLLDCYDSWVTPPAILQIVQERVRPGAEPAYGRLEEQLAQACASLGAPHPYLALASITRPTEVWWLNMYESEADVARIAEAYAGNAPLTAALREGVAGKAGMAGPPVELMTRFRSDLSAPHPWRIGELRFAAVLERPSPVKSAGAVFESPDGRVVVLIAAAGRKDAERRAAQLGSGARLFEVRPEWSLPEDAWVSRNPALWKRRTSSVSL